MDMELAMAVREMQDRQEIYDCIMRYCRGVDRFDRDILASAYHPGAVDDHGKFVGTPEDFIDWVFALHATYHRRTQHMITNHICELDGDIAHTESHYIFRSVNMAPPFHSMSSGRYINRMERRAGQRGIVARICTVDIFDEHWDPTGETRDGCHPATARDGSDPSYLRPLTIDPARFIAGKRMPL
jgi:hypothetical protein